MKPRMHLKEKAVHGTPLLPVAIHHLSYPAHTDNFFYLHWHDEFEMIVVLEGAIVYTIEEQEYCLQAGEGLFVPSNSLHAARSHNGQPCEACVVLFHPRLFGDTQQGSAYARLVYPVLRGELILQSVWRGEEEWERLVLQRLKEIDGLRDSSLTDVELLLKSKLFEIWHYCCGHASSGISAGRERHSYKLERFKPVLDYIKNNYKDEITLNRLAGLLPMSEGQFCHAFKEVMNLPPIAYVIRYRILQSCSLLMETDWKISDISRSVGFNNISYFNREFIKAIGCSPGQYRREG